ncbi:MAG TPA: hypothetical protein VKA84_27040 [Gemmatimonadaceae bacterium]|nr:hypothetical protein [Gemmatimonadaceae bacterium]
MSEGSMKNQAPDEDEIPENIDFSGGVRGKYVHRYREGVSVRELPPIDPIRFYEIQSRLGYALWQTQALASTIVAFLSLVLDMSPGAAAVETARILEHDAGSHLRHLIEETGTRFPRDFSAEVQQRLMMLLRERNWLVHHSRYELEAELSAPERARGLTSRLELLGDEAQYLNQVIASILERELSQRGLSVPEIRERTREVLDTWAAA